MSICRRETHKIAFVAALIIFLSGCFFSADGVSFFDQGTAVTVCDVRHQQKLSAADGIGNKNVAEHTFSNSVNSFLRMEPVGRQTKNTNRIFFHLFPAVLFRMAVIPNVVGMEVFAVMYQVFWALQRILGFVHASDGKKETALCYCG